MCVCVRTSVSYGTKNKRTVSNERLAGKNYDNKKKHEEELKHWWIEYFSNKNNS